MKFSLNPKYTKPLKPFFKQLFSYNRAYRIFLFFVLLSWSWWNFILALMLFFLALLVLDPKFRKYCLAVRKRQYQKQAKEEESSQNTIVGLEIINYIIFFIRGAYFYIMGKILPHLTRLPFFEDYFRDNALHHRNRYYLKFANALDGNRENRKFIIYYIDIDSYHATFYIRLDKSITPTKARIKLNRIIKNYFGEIPDGTIIKLKRRTGQVLIPIEKIKKD